MGYGFSILPGVTTPTERILVKQGSGQVNGWSNMDPFVLLALGTWRPYLSGCIYMN